jgi:predicted XRE-type DNA-binding protein
VCHNNRKKAFDIRTGRAVFSFPYSKADPEPSRADPVAMVGVDPDMGREGFTYTLKSGKKGAVHVEQVLDYNQDPAYTRDALLYRLTILAQRQIESSRLSRREIVRRLGTSAPQLYRLLDQTNYRKSIDKMLALFHVLDCDVDLVVRPRRRSGKSAA